MTLEIDLLVALGAVLAMATTGAAYVFFNAAVVLLVRLLGPGQLTGGHFRPVAVTFSRDFACDKGWRRIARAAEMARRAREADHIRFLSTQSSISRTNDLHAGEPLSWRPHRSVYLGMQGLKLLQQNGQV